MLWTSHDTQDSSYSTTTPQAYNNVSLVHTHSLVSAPSNFICRTNYPPPPSNGQSYLASVTPTRNYTIRKNLPKLLPQVPIDPEPYPSFSYSSSLESSDSLNPGYCKQGWHIHKKHWNKIRNNDLIKKCTNHTDKLLTYIYKSKVMRFKLD